MYLTVHNYRKNWCGNGLKEMMKGTLEYQYIVINNSKRLSLRLFLYIIFNLKKYSLGRKFIDTWFRAGIKI